MIFTIIVNKQLMTTFVIINVDTFTIILLLSENPWCTANSSDRNFYDSTVALHLLMLLPQTCHNHPIARVVETVASQSLKLPLVLQTSHGYSSQSYASFVFEHVPQFFPHAGKKCDNESARHKRQHNFTVCWAYPVSMSRRRSGFADSQKKQFRRVFWPNKFQDFCVYACPRDHNKWPSTVEDIRAETRQNTESWYPNLKWESITCITEFVKSSI